MRPLLQIHIPVPIPHLSFFIPQAHSDNLSPDVDMSTAFLDQSSSDCSNLGDSKGESSLSDKIAMTADLAGGAVLGVVAGDVGSESGAIGRMCAMS